MTFFQLGIDSTIGYNLYRRLLPFRLQSNLSVLSNLKWSEDLLENILQIMQYMLQNRYARHVFNNALQKFLHNYSYHQLVVLLVLEVCN